ncbi:DNA-binding protein, partial [Rhizodiscina lignyota]
FTSFLTICVHTILYQRTIYPRESFLTTRAYDFPVAQSRHPKVCRWISDAVAAVEAQMLRANDKTGEAGGWVEKIVLVIFSEESEVMERYVFDVSKLPRVPGKEIETRFIREQAPVGGSSKAPQRGQPHFIPPSQLEVDLAEQLRASLSQMSNLNSRLAPLPKNCTFSLAIELSDPADPPVGHPRPWIPVDPRLQRCVDEGNRNESTEEKTGLGKAAVDAHSKKTTPVRKVDAGEMIFEMWIEEAKAKLD